MNWVMLEELIFVGGAIILLYMFSKKPATFCPGGDPTPTEWIIFHNMGDVDNDGEISLVDAALLNGAILDGPPFDLRYDLNGDGYVDLADAEILDANAGKTICEVFGL